GNEPNLNDYPVALVDWGVAPRDVARVLPLAGAELVYSLRLRPILLIQIKEQDVPIALTVRPRHPCGIGEPNRRPRSLEVACHRHSPLGVGGNVSIAAGWGRHPLPVRRVEVRTCEGQIRVNNLSGRGSGQLLLDVVERDLVP